MLFTCAALAALVAMPACSSDPEATVRLDVGGETDTFSRAPAPTRLVVDSIDTATGQATTWADVPLPADSIDLGDRSHTPLVRIRANALDAAGRVLVSGTSVAVQLGALAGMSLPIFVQRTGELARMPAPLSDAREAPLLANVIGRYVFAAGGGTAATQIYDMATLSAYTKPPTMPRTARSIAAWGTAILLIDDAGATWFELGNSATQVATVPSGGTFAEVAGGDTIQAPDATLYVVGGTRRAGPTSRVLKITREGTLLFLSLNTARTGAAATWVEGRGLVVAGGSDAGNGVEILAAGATASTVLAFPPDPTTFAGAATLDGSHLLLAGGLDAAGQPAATREIDLGCTNACTFIPWDSAKLPVSLPTAQAFGIASDAAFIVGDDAAGVSHAVRVSRQAAVEIPFKAARRGARGVRVNPPAITIVGGASVIESFTP